MTECSAALVLSGGGALGAAHIGALKVLEEQNLTFDRICGVSAGAIVGALAAMGRRSEEMLRTLAAVDFFSLAFNLTRSRLARRGGSKLEALLDELFGERSFEDLPVRLLLGATDFCSGERVLLDRGSVRDAVRASISVPLFIEPFRHPQLQRWLVDGGLSQNFPLDWAVAEYHGSRIYEIDAATALGAGPEQWDGGVPSSERGFRRTLQRVFRIMLLSQQTALPADPRVVYIKPELGPYSAVDVRRISAIVQAGEEAARKAVRALQAVEA